MKNATWIPFLAAALITACFGGQAQAGYLGAGSYNCCPTEACTSCGDYSAAKECSSTCYKTVVETVEQPWLADAYQLVVGTVLEDLAGNSIARPFAIDLSKKQTASKTVGEVVTLPFSIK